MAAGLEQNTQVAGHHIGPARGVPLFDSAGVRALERCAIETFGIAGAQLMQRAGNEAFAAFRRRWPRRGNLAVMCGPGNNGGDGFAVARLAAQSGWRVKVFTLGPVSAIRGDAARTLALLRESGIEAAPAQSMVPSRFDAVVDALFGIGLSRALDGPAASCVAQINEVAGPCLALDIPSGLQADTGRVCGVCVRATLTVSFIAYKPGLFTGQGPDYVGERVIAPLALPFRVQDQRAPDAWRLEFRDLAPVLGPRAPSDHKGVFGRVLIIGGDHGFAGAVSMAAEAAARVGCGLTTVATRSGHHQGVLAGRPEVMVRAVEDDSALNPLLDSQTVLGVGPGLGTGVWGRWLLERVSTLPAALVLDADGLNLLAAEESFRRQLSQRSQDTVLTPHPGEAARLLKCSVSEVECDRVRAAAALSERFRCVVLLKGAGTVVCAAGSVPVICSAGHPAMASGGMGDVLTGVVCGLMAQGLSAHCAAVSGALIHGQAAHRVHLRKRLERGLLASDLMPELSVLASRL